MTKKEFMEVLSGELSRCNNRQFVEDVLDDFEEHFSNAAESGISEEETSRILGNPKEIAADYLADFERGHFKEASPSPQNNTEGNNEKHWENPGRKFEEGDFWNGYENSGNWSNPWGANRNDYNKISFTGASNFSLSVMSASIQVEMASGNELEVFLQDRLFNISQSGGHIIISERGRFFIPGAREVRVFIPRGFTGKYNLRSVSGSIHVERTPGEVTVNTVSGSISIDKDEDLLSMSSVSGSLKLYTTRINKPLRLNTVSGRINVECKNIEADVSFDTVSGSVHLDIANPAPIDFRFKSLSGKMKGDYRNPPPTQGTKPVTIRCNTVSGNLHVN